MSPEYQRIARDILIVLREEAANEERITLVELITPMLGKNTPEYDRALIDVLNLLSSRNKKIDLERL